MWGGCLRCKTNRNNSDETRRAARKQEPYIRTDHHHHTTAAVFLIVINMCWQTPCRTCGKPSWGGCGMHIESALRGVPVEARCPGWRSGKCAPSQAASKPGGAAAAATAASPAFSKTASAPTTLKTKTSTPVANNNGVQQGSRTPTDNKTSSGSANSYAL